MNELSKRLAYTEQPQYGYIANEPGVVDETWMLSLPALGGIANRGLKTIGEYLPYINDIWQGRGLLFHKPFDWMTPEEYTNFGRKGVEFYKSVLNPRKAESRYIENPINFPNSKAGESDYKYMEQYPLVVKNIKEALSNVYKKVKPKIDKNGNEYIRKDAKGFHNLKVKWKGKEYDYQIRDNAYNKENDFYNIKPYEKLDE